MSANVPCGQAHPDFDVYHPGGHPADDGRCACCGQIIRRRADLRLTQRKSDSFDWDANGVASVHDFAGDPAFNGERDGERFGYYIAGNHGWVTGFDTKEAAGEAALDAIWNGRPDR